MTDLLISSYHLCIHSSNIQRYDSTELPRKFRAS